MNKVDTIPDGQGAAADYEPIADYALIGDSESAALISLTGSVDWLCWPHFSSPSLLAALLDHARGGRFRICPRDVVRVERRYVSYSAVLETLFHCTTGILSLTDFMPMTTTDDSRHELIRLAECRAGEVVVDVFYQPRPDYARHIPRIESLDGLIWSLQTVDATVQLATDTELAPSPDAASLVGACRLSAGEARRFALIHASAPVDADHALRRSHARMRETIRSWEKWYEQCSYQGPYRDAVVRSCLTLRLLAHRDSGAVVAAPTTSLPESLGSGRNWDYRYCWLRDTSLLLQSFVDLGFTSESQAFLGWLLHVARKPLLLPLYDVNGEPVSDEIILPHLEGYRGSGPVRVGNSAHGQLQLDIYGEVIQTAYRFVCRGGRLTARERRLFEGLGDTVCRQWGEPDQSIWETRNGPKHYTYSKLMCWVALDRLIALHRLIDLGIDEARVGVERERIRHAIEEHGFNQELGSYVAYFGGSEPDASLLLMARYGFARATDRRMDGTYRYITDRLSLNGLLYRYPPDAGFDGVAGRENVFVVCSFWVVDFLARAGKLAEATQLFERLLGFANDLGLYSEQYDPVSGQALGNFPQAFSHSGLITAALAIEQCRRGWTEEGITS
ncbi:MAG TPA: glycoside hydrolase family 15 protein [Aromatoleum sp.]|uniref:glycoside hydrolase family 15 protein n=1 Tax=Aromatoleum sp. TaxID=2307007 RepID=UPI002B48F6E9|nr:glycoside hydrolase family 15 protein [Aromatoleum sp.]HJV26923.1 glycoside hydrolase family 15 protein [Aromatoleum sp.]